VAAAVTTPLTNTQFGLAASVSFNPANPAATASTTFVMMGLGSTATYTPIKTGRVEVTVSYILANGTINDGVTALAAFGTGVAPVNGAAFSGTTFGPTVTTTSLVAAQQVGYCFTFTVTMTVGVANWVDLQLKAVTGGSASAVACVFQFAEVFV
jgi:hypothetical protein